MSKDQLKQLFKDGCPEPRGSAEFRSRVLEHTHAERSSHRARLGVSLGEKAMELLLSPLPVAVATAILIAIYGGRVMGLLGDIAAKQFTLSLEQLIQSPVLISVCSLSALGCVIFYISQLSRLKSVIDLQKIRLELEEKRQ